LDKIAVHNTVLQLLEAKFQVLKKELSDILESTANESKSTVGDKHETGRAMAQLEQEKLSNQLMELERVKGFLFQINPNVKCLKVVIGSLVETNLGWYYISSGLGAISQEGFQIFTMNIQAPLGKILSGKNEGEVVNWNGKELKILKIY
jgi:transcription elongation GreA/GreB family factor